MAVVDVAVYRIGPRPTEPIVARVLQRWRRHRQGLSGFSFLCLYDTLSI